MHIVHSRALKTKGSLQKCTVGHALWRDYAFQPSTTCTASRASTHGRASAQTVRINSVFELFLFILSSFFS